jgi:hypothetical protein
MQRRLDGHSESWGMVIGRPGIMKSPPVTEIVRLLQVLQAHARTEFEISKLEFDAGKLRATASEKVAKA